MERIYIDGNEAKFTRRDLTLVDMELGGKIYENIEPRRLFPATNADKFITLLDESGTEQAVIRDLNTLPEAQRKIIEECLDEYYLIPRIIQVLDMNEKLGVVILDTVTDRGPIKIEVRNQLHGIKLVPGRRVLIRDGNDNRYEIPNIEALDAHSRRLLDCYV